MIHSLCQCTGYSYALLLIPSKIHKRVLARYLVMQYVFKNLKWGKDEVGNMFDLDRATAYHGLNSIESERADIAHTLPWRRKMIERFDKNVKEWEVRKDMKDNYPFVYDSLLDHVYGKEYEPIDLTTYGRIC